MLVSLIMGFLLDWLFGRNKPEELFLRGRDSFADKEYNKAYSYFLQSFRRFSKINYKMRLNCLAGAATAIELAGNSSRAAVLLYEQAQLHSETGGSVSELLEILKRSVKLHRKTNSKHLHEAMAVQFIVELADQDLESAEALVRKVEALNRDDKGFRFIRESWALVVSREAYTRGDTLPNFPVPRQFIRFRTRAEEVMQAYSSLKVVFEESSLPSKVSAGNHITVQCVVKPFAPLELQQLAISPGNKGIIVKNPVLPVPCPLNEEENYNSEFILEPQLSGEWVIGPVYATYALGNHVFKVASNTLTTTIEESKPIIKLTTAVSEVDTGKIYQINCQISNIGKSIAEKIHVKFDLPAGISIIEGTKDKIISTLSRGENINFNLSLRFDMNPEFLAEKNLKWVAKVDDQIFQQSLLVQELLAGKVSTSSSEK